MKVLASPSWSFRCVLFFVPLLGGSAISVIACSDDEGQHSSFEIDGSFTPTLPEAQVGPEDAPPVAATMRLAHLAPELAPIDFCWQATGTGTFEGPVLGRGTTRAPDAGVADANMLDATDASFDADADAEPPRALAYREVSRYLVIETAGPVTLAVVPGGSATCANPLFVADVTLDPGKLVTIAAMGDANVDAGVGALGLATFVDDRSAIADKARVRIVHAAPTAPPIVVRAVSSKTVTIADGVTARRVPTSTSIANVDMLGYATIDPLPSPASLAVVPTESSDAEAGVAGWQSDPAELGLAGGSLHTGFVLSGVNRPFEVIWCADTITEGDRTSCTRVR